MAVISHLHHLGWVHLSFFDVQWYQGAGKREGGRERGREGGGGGRGSVGGGRTEGLSLSMYRWASG